jgi:DNA polymerase III gamma/tau subunit
MHPMRTLVSLAAMAILAVPALAQPRQGGGFGGPLFLLTNKSVQEELKITDDQKKKVEDASKKFNDMRQEKMKEAGITVQNRREKREEMDKINKALSPEADKALASALSVLDEKQTKRFKQIRLQQQGLRAFSSEEVQTALKLNDDKKKKIKELSEEGTKSIEDQTKDLTRGDFAKRMEITTKVNKETLGKIAATLSSDQKKTWKEMTGDAFEVKFAPPGGGGVRPGGTPPARPDLSK